MSTRRFQRTAQGYEAATHATTETATLQLEPGHLVTRRHSHMNAYGPVRGSHHVEYRCSCGGTTIGRHATGPRLADLDLLPHYRNDQERADAEAALGARAERVHQALRIGDEA